MNSKIGLRGWFAASLLALPLVSGCAEPPPSGPGGGPSSGTTGSTNPPGVGAVPTGSGTVSGH